MQHTACSLMLKHDCLMLKHNRKLVCLPSLFSAQHPSLMPIHSFHCMCARARQATYKLPDSKSWFGWKHHSIVTGRCTQFPHACALANAQAEPRQYVVNMTAKLVLYTTAKACVVESTTQGKLLPSTGCLPPSRVSAAWGHVFVLDWLMARCAIFCMNLQLQTADTGCRPCLSYASWFMP